MDIDSFNASIFPINDLDDDFDSFLGPIDNSTSLDSTQTRSLRSAPIVSLPTSLVQVYANGTLYESPIPKADTHCTFSSLIITSGP